MIVKSIMVIFWNDVFHLWNGIIKLIPFLYPSLDNAHFEMVLYVHLFVNGVTIIKKIFSKIIWFLDKSIYETHLQMVLQKTI